MKPKWFLYLYAYFWTYPVELCLNWFPCSVKFAEAPYWSCPFYCETWSFWICLISFWRLLILVNVFIGKCHSFCVNGIYVTEPNCLMHCISITDMLITCTRTDMSMLGWGFPYDSLDLLLIGSCYFACLRAFSYSIHWTFHICLHYKIGTFCVSNLCCMILIHVLIPLILP